MSEGRPDGGNNGDSSGAAFILKLLLALAALFMLAGVCQSL